MRGKIDLSKHKLANVFRPPAPRSRWRRYRQQSKSDVVYRQLVRLVDGAVRDALANHPEYLTKLGQRHAQTSIVKRVVGTLWGYGREVSFAAQAAQGRSAGVVDAPRQAAAKVETPTNGPSSPKVGCFEEQTSDQTVLAKGLSWARAVLLRPRRQDRKDSQ